jgi:MFS family permease
MAIDHFSGIDRSELGSHLCHRGDCWQHACPIRDVSNHFVVGMAACLLPAGEIARRFGRRIAFMVGTSTGALTGILAALAIYFGWFWLFCFSAFLGGAYASVTVSFRFDAADGVPDIKQAQVKIERSLTEIATQPRFISALICGAASYLIMNFLMTSAPLAMHKHKHSHESANLDIQWHVMAMYVPSFFRLTASAQPWFLRLVLC